MKRIVWDRPVVFDHVEFDEPTVTRLAAQSAIVDAKELLERYAAGKRDFRYAKLEGAHLPGADLRDADLRRAHLH